MNINTLSIESKMEKNSYGYLEIVLGPMFSGKTSKLIEVYKQYSFCDIRVLVINHAEDTRYSETMMNTHDQVSITCIQSETILSVVNEHIDLFTGKEPLAILINEGQFFPDLYKAVYEIINMHKKHVYVAGLDGDCKREKFGQILDIIPLCDKVYKLSALCVNCKNGTKAIFSHRTDPNCTTQKKIGSSDMYIPLCRNCYDAAIL